ncbi:MAG: hypothetical protein JXX29_08040 [Deltaproteobacteria bacterium]|nr:hypothetical protein [Deltaproteobacteria bacterium]MBN2671609.1 hypothetical protein [Deltaproteobacteria bacterium]
MTTRNRNFKLFSRGGMHLHIALTTVFVVLLATSSIAGLTYTYLQISRASMRTAWQTMRETNSGVYRNVVRYIGRAKSSSTATEWALRDVAQIHDNEDRILPLLIGQIRSQRSVFSVTVADSSGSMLRVSKTYDEPTYSVNRDKKLPPEVKYRIQQLDRSVSPVSENYQYLNADMEVIDEEIRPAEDITERRDARRRSWYKEAVRAKENVWTDVKVRRNGEFGTSNATPILNPDGTVRMVVSSSIILSLKDGLSRRLNVAKNGIAFVIDGDGQLLMHPDQSKITQCPKEEERCRFNKINEIGDSALEAAFQEYQRKTDLSKPENTPRRLNYQEYMRRIDRLDPPLRKAFDKLYNIDEQNEKIRLQENPSAEARKLLPEILSAIRYTYNVRFTDAKTEYLASFHSFPGRFGKPWIVGTMVPIDDFVGRLKATLEQVAVFSVGIVLIAIILIIIISRRILKPLAHISSDMARIQNLDIDESVKHASFFYEIDRIGVSLDSMKHGLAAFSKFVPVTLVKQLIAQKTGAELGGEKRRLTMMFTDIQGFTTISESMETEALLQHISEYLDRLTTIILNQNGTVDKYIGDAIMSFWGAPIADEKHEMHACRAALLCARELNVLNAKWDEEGKPALVTRFGISTGEVSVGNMGSSERMNYTVLGDAVNLAARLEGINKYYGTRIIVGAATREVVKDQFLMRPVDIVAVKGKVQGVAIYELFAATPDDAELPPSEEQLQCSELTEQAFAAYLAQDFKTAFSAYRRLGELFPNDVVASMFCKRCEEYLKTPPGPDWTGVTHMTQK